MKYRLYIDEVGNGDLESSRNPNERYLSLTGVILELDYVRDVVHHELEALKEKYFHSHPDEPVILHRKELMNKRYPFHALRDSIVETAFNAELLGYLSSWNYAVVTVTIDKLQHLEQYQTWHYHPYHYCLEVLVERYILWLERQDVVGDVMAETRGSREDRQLKTAFNRIATQGNEFIEARRFEVCLTSRQLKMCGKDKNVCGLQLADVLAHPSYRAVLARQNNSALPDNFGGKIAQILEESKYVRSPSGRIDGWGRKWLP